MVAGRLTFPRIMGFFKDLKQLNDTGKQMQRDAGIRGGFGGMKDAVSQANATLQGFQQTNADQQRIIASGTVATGIVKGIRDTGMMVNMSPQIEFDLEVTIPGQPAYTDHDPAGRQPGEHPAGPARPAGLGAGRPDGRQPGRARRRLVELELAQGRPARVRARARVRAPGSG